MRTVPAIRRRIVAVMVRILIHIGHLVAQGRGVGAWHPSDLAGALITRWGGPIGSL